MEIERKFLVDKLIWGEISKPQPKHIIQAYLLRTPEKTIRIRIKEDKGFLTIKGETIGISRSEFEYEIPLSDAKEMIAQFADKVIEKFRYELTVGNHLWEVDEFTGNLESLILAEIELGAENEQFQKPSWATKDVSLDPQYYNSMLIERC